MSSSRVAAQAAIGIGVMVFFVTVPARSRESGKKPGVRQYFAEIGEGVRYVGSEPFLKKFLVLSALFNILIAPVAVMTPLQVARNWGEGVLAVIGGFLAGPEQRLAMVEVAFFGGMMLGGLVIGVWGGFKNKSHTMALSTFFLGLSTVGLGLIADFRLYLLCMGLAGLMHNLFNPPMMATLQTKVDPAYMGRVFSVLTMLGSVMMPLSMVFWGPLGDAIPIGWLLAGTGAAVFLMGFVFVLDKTLLEAGKAT